MRELLAQEIAKLEHLPIKIEGNGRLEMDNGVYKVSWASETGDILETFDLYSNGDWDYQKEYIEGDENKVDGMTGTTLEPHNKRWINKLVKLGYDRAYVVTSVWFEWDNLARKAKSYKR
jgi:hypothetical protein